MSRPKHPLLCLLLAGLVVLFPSSTEWLQWRARTILRPLPSPPAITDKNVRNTDAYSIALRYFRSHSAEFKNRRYITIIDYTKPSCAKRLYLINTQTGEVGKFFVSHGKNSGFSYASSFSNTPGSFRSSRGFFRTGSVYRGKLGTCLELHGLQKGINDKALSRGIVMHGAHYAGPESIILNRGRLGRSQGCPAVPMEHARELIGKIKNGSLLYIHAG